MGYLRRGGGNRELDGDLERDLPFGLVSSGYDSLSNMNGRYLIIPSNGGGDIKSWTKIWREAHLLVLFPVDTSPCHTRMDDT